MLARVIVAIVLILLPAAALAQAEKRVALLIGNQAYGSEIGRLSNPHNDIALLEKALKGFGFEVATVRDAGLGGLHQAVNNYARNCVRLALVLEPVSLAGNRQESCPETDSARPLWPARGGSALRGGARRCTGWTRRGRLRGGRVSH